MEDRESAAGVKRLVLILRRVTFAVQVLPFVYSSLYIVSLVLYGNVPEEAQMAADSLLYVSPVCIAAFLVLSRILKLCRWHRTACVIPAVPLVVNFIDYYVVSFSETFVNVFNYMVAAMCALLLVAAYNVFFR